MAWEVVAAVALALMSVVFLPRYLRLGITTIPELVQRRFGPRARDAMSFVILINIVFFILPFVLYSGALAMNSLFDTAGMLGVDDRAALWIAVVSIGIVGSVYALAGGMRAIAVSDTFNGVGLLVGGFLIPALGLMKLGEGNFFEGVSRIVRERPEMLNAIGGPESAVPWETLFTGMFVINVAYWCSNQFIIQRTLAARSLAEGQKGTLLAGFLKLLGPLYLVLPGIIAWHLFAGNLAHSDLAYPSLVAAVLPAPLAGFFGAVLFGAVLSTFNSALNSVSTIFSLDVWKAFRPGAGQREIVRVGRVFGLVVAVFSVGVAPFFAFAPQGMFNLMKEFSGLFAAQATVAVLALFTTRPGGRSAIIALAMGAAIYATCKWGLNDQLGGQPFHWLHSYFLAVVVPGLSMIVSGRIAPSKEPMKSAASDGAVDMAPWRLAGPVAAMLVVATLAVYFVFSRF